jgi:hypothetical protein
MMKQILLFTAAAVLVAHVTEAAIRVSPSEVNVSSQGATTVFLTFGGLTNQAPAEGLWCGALVPAAPDIGSRCDPARTWGRLPLRFDQSRPSGTNGFTDIMSITPSSARRAFEAARSTQASAFFYVRRFVSTVGGPDEYVVVVCRMASGGARTALALLDVRLAFAGGIPIAHVNQGANLPAMAADITYNGTGRLKGRWEVVVPGDEPPTDEDLLTEATLPIEARGKQRRYRQIERFNLFLPPTGRVTLPGPSVARLPTETAGAYMILLRVEASDDQDGDSDLSEVGTGPSVVHNGGVAGFPMPVVRYIVGAGAPPGVALRRGALELLLPADEATVGTDVPLDLSWLEHVQAAVYRVDIYESDRLVLSGLVPSGTAVYRMPPWVQHRVAGGALRWRVAALDVNGQEIGVSGWRLLKPLR